MDYDLKSLEIKILSPYEACQYTLERVKMVRILFLLLVMC